MNVELHSPATERRVLSFLNLDGELAMRLCAEHGLSADTFYVPSYRAIFESALALHAASQLLSGEILGEHVCDRTKSATYAEFVEATQQIPPYGIYPSQLPPLCRELRSLQKKREMKRATESLSLAIKDGDEDATAKAIAIIQQSDISTKPRATWHQTGGVELDRAKAIIAGQEDPDVRSLHWPWATIDIALKPFRRGEQVVVAGYTSNGKSSLLRQLILACAYRGHNAAFVSLEVPAADIFNLMASAVSGQPWSRLKGLHPTDQAEFMRAGQQVRGMSIEVLDDTHSLHEILAWLRNQHSRRFLDVIAIDYLGLVNECSPVKGQTKAAAVGEVACAFKRLAVELGCVLFLAVQINRGPTTDNNREPRLSDLKDSGDIEAHADRVLLLFRPDKDKTSNRQQAVHESLAERPRFYMELFQEKGRNVGTGSTALWLRRELAKFELIAG